MFISRPFQLYLIYLIASQVPHKLLLTYIHLYLDQSTKIYEMPLYSLDLDPPLFPLLFLIHPKILCLLLTKMNLCINILTSIYSHMIINQIISSMPLLSPYSLISPLSNAPPPHHLDASVSRPLIINLLY